MSIDLRISPYYFCMAEQQQNMHTKRTIALVGNGTQAQSLAAALVKGNNRLLFFSREFNDAKAAAALVKNNNASADIEAIPCSYTATWEADIIISVIPFNELKELTAHIKDVAVQKILVAGEMSNEEEEYDLHKIKEVEQTLPFTNIITASFSIDQNDSVGYVLNGNKEEAIETIQDLFEGSGMIAAMKTSSNQFTQQNNVLQSLINHQKTTQ